MHEHYLTWRQHKTRVLNQHELKLEFSTSMNLLSTQVIRLIREGGGLLLGPCWRQAGIQLHLHRMAKLHASG
jgi:hypothetical protein